EREMNVIATSLRLPSERLVMTYASVGGGQPSYILQRIAELLSLPVEPVTPLVMTEAEKPCFELALREGEAAGAAYGHFAADPDMRARIDAVRASAKTTRGRLARLTAESLYGKKLGVTASRAEKFRSCRFAYFMQYGLNARPRRKAELDAMTAGSFMHFVLENVCREVGRGGFAAVTDEALRAMTARYVAAYAENVLGGLVGKSGRFRCLYARLGRDAEEIVLDMAGEMCVSSFEPYDFELEFSSYGDMPPASVTDGDVDVRVRGKVDRVDGWVKDGRLYLRVVDYKTGKKSFSLSDVWYGMGMQMLIYLFVLQRHGAERYGMETVPAGVLYAPARDVLLSAERGETPETIRREREKKLVRSGLLLSDPEVIEAMEHGEPHKYLPVKITKDGQIAGDALASAEQLGALAAHVDAVLLEMGRELRKGDVAADPFYRNDSDNACLYCDFCEACRFGESAEDGTRYLRKLKPADVWLKMREEETDG
ncbi:MAG: PD-(D/E)XK nuclease family protein, partial [Oscillospiraceae bacterium]|nr:PD-(D/E)XK nuclease family protein [Oscillospiraceae bacterium]